MRDSQGAVLNCAGGLNHRPEELHPPLNWVMGAFTRVVSSEFLGPFVFSQVRRKTSHSQFPQAGLPQPRGHHRRAD